MDRSEKSLIVEFSIVRGPSYSTHIPRVLQVCLPWLDNVAHSKVKIEYFHGTKMRRGCI